MVAFFPVDVSVTVQRQVEELSPVSAPVIETLIEAEVVEPDDHLDVDPDTCAHE
jgi:hypothetical protein